MASYGDEDVAALVVDNGSGMLKSQPCGPVPDVFLDLDLKKYLTVYVQNKEYVGEKVSLVCDAVRHDWVLTIKISTGETVSFRNDEVVAITRHT